MPSNFTDEFWEIKNQTKPVWCNKICFQREAPPKAALLDLCSFMNQIHVQPYQVQFYTYAKYLIQTIELSTNQG